MENTQAKNIFSNWLTSVTVEQIEVYINRVKAAIENGKIKNPNYHMMPVWENGLAQAEEEIEKRKINKTYEK